MDKLGDTRPSFVTLSFPPDVYISLLSLFFLFNRLGGCIAICCPVQLGPPLLYLLLDDTRVVYIYHPPFLSVVLIDPIDSLCSKTNYSI